jgi:hypothetical protein
MATLDGRLQEELAKVARCSDFKLTAWRQDPDGTGSNWNARLERIGGSNKQDITWWDVVPSLRANTNLKE